MLSFLIPAIIIGATIALAWPLGRYMRWAMDPVDAGPNRLPLRVGVRCHPWAASGERAKLETVLPVDARVQRGDVRVRVRGADDPAVASGLLNPDGKEAARAEPGVQHGGELHEQHEFAALFGRSRR